MNITEEMTREAGWFNEEVSNQLTNKEEKNIKYFDKKAEKYGFETSWCLHQIKALVYPSPFKGKWMTNGVNNDIKIPLPNHKLSGLELWKYADELYKLLGDTDHRFIEEFKLNDDTIEVFFGS
jgi:hypothetical protein